MAIQRVICIQLEYTFYSLDKVIRFFWATWAITSNIIPIFKFRRKQRTKDIHLHSVPTVTQINGKIEKKH